LIVVKLHNSDYRKLP